MRKTLCLLLSLVLVLSCCTVINTAAADNENDEQENVYLLGDVDLDKEVTVIDVTMLQRGLAELVELDGLSQKLGDVDGSGINITDVTLLQRYGAKLPTGYPIGENIADENEGVVYQEDVPWYKYGGGGIVENEYPLYFSTAYPDVPFVSDQIVMDTYAHEYAYEDEPAHAEADDSAVHTYSTEMGTTVSFDYDKKLMIFSDYTTTLTYNGAMTYNPFSLQAKAETTFYQMTQMDRYYGGDPMVATYAYDEVPMLRSGSDILIPLQSLTDLFLSYGNTFYQYNGKALFTLNGSTPQNPDQAEFWAMYRDTDKLTTISKEWAQVNYYELCNVFDARYGLQAAHNIEDFDAYFARKGLKSQMLSTDLETIEKAEVEISTLLFEDFHSATNVNSPFLDGTITADASMLSPLYINRQLKFAEVESTRKLKMGDNIPPYERRGDTVFITFDGFKFSGKDYYYQEGFEPSPDGDTVELFAYALKRLQNEDSDAKNVVIDVSVNGGGTVYACGFAMDAICGKCILCLQNPNSWALHQCVYKFDLNLDGTIDMNDRSMLTMGKNVAIITSDHSFSCGNALPCSIDAIDDRVLLLGQTSGGGACEVARLTTATGAMMQFSGESRFVTMKNGYIRDIDGGVTPDVTLTLNRMFDRDYITNLVDDHFG